MPCTFTGSLEGDRLLAMKEALDRRERMLCAVCALMESLWGLADTETVLRAAAGKAEGLHEDEIATWWHQHKIADAAGRLGD